MTHQEKLLGYLSDAYAMEHQSLEFFQHNRVEVPGNPLYAKRIEDHISQTHEQIRVLENTLRGKGITTSSKRAVGGEFTDISTRFSSLFTQEDIVKASLACFTFKQLEIGAYEIMSGIALECDEHEIFKTCSLILEQEDHMANWLRGYFRKIP